MLRVLGSGSRAHVFLTRERVLLHNSGFRNKGSWLKFQVEGTEQPCRFEGLGSWVLANFALPGELRIQGVEFIRFRLLCGKSGGCRGSPFLLGELRVQGPGPRGSGGFRGWCGKRGRVLGSTLFCSASLQVWAMVSAWKPGTYDLSAHASPSVSPSCQPGC